MTSTQPFEMLFKEILARVEGVEGWMSDNELEMLALLAGFPTANGMVLEIGSYRGRSTIALALAAEFTGDGSIAAVDPLSDTGPYAPVGPLSARDQLMKNLEAAGVADRIEFHQKLSGDLAPSWDRPLRLLWIDGDHDLAAVQSDLVLFRPHLSNGAIVAFHDVVGRDAGPIRVFADDVLASPHFGPSGFTGSIGWAQYFDDPAVTEPYRPRNALLRKRLHVMINHFATEGRLNWLQRRLSRMNRRRIPHGRAPVQRWITAMAPNHVAKTHQRGWSPPLMMNTQGQARPAPPTG